MARVEKENMVFPLGLGFGFIRIPVWTLVLIGSLFAYYVYESNERAEVNLEIRQAYDESGVMPSITDLFQEYCPAHSDDKSSCALLSQALPKHYGEKPKNLGRQIRRKGGNFQNVLKVLKATPTLTRFSADLQHGADSITSLSGYPAYTKYMANLKERLADLQHRHNLLSTRNLTPSSLLHAQFQHANAMHIFGNALFLLVFGAYVELRMGAGLFLVTYFLGGFIGLSAYLYLFPNSLSHLVGASANISALMGAFLVLFFSFRMKFFVWTGIGTRTFYAPVSLFFPLLYVLAEIVGAWGSRGNQFGGIAHGAHVAGLAVGMLMGLLCKALFPLPWPYVTEEERARTLDLKRSRDVHETITLASKLLSYNPENVFARYWPILAIASCDAPIDWECQRFLETQMPACAAILLRRKRGDVILKLLSRLPAAIDFSVIFRGSGQSTLLRLGDSALATKDFVVAMRAFEAYARLFPRSRDLKGVESTLQEILRKGTEDERLADYLSHTNSEEKRAVTT